MSFLDQYKTDPNLENDGVWVNNFADGMDIKVRRFNSPLAREVRDREERPYQGLVRSGGKIPDSAVEEIMLTVMAEAIVADWRGKSTEDFPATPENIATALQVQDFRNQVAAIAYDRDTFKGEMKEEGVGN